MRRRSTAICSAWLAVDPEEKFHGNPSNDGGTRFVRSNPSTPEQARTDPTFANGTVVSADFGPSRQRPFYSYFSVDLTAAYSEKIEEYGVQARPEMGRLFR